MTTVQLWIISGVAFYMAAMLLIGWWASRRIHDTKDYIVAGGRLGWMLFIGTIFATWFGAETCMGSSGTAFNKGILGVIADPFGAGLCLIISGLFFAKYFKKLNIETIVDYFQIRYGKNAAWFLGIIYIPVYLGWIGAQLLAFCRGSVILLCTFSLMLALYFRNIYKLCQESWGVLLTGVVAPMAAGVYWKRANTIGAVSGAVAGVLSWILFKIFMPENFPHNLFGFFISSVVLVFASLITQKE